MKHILSLVLLVIATAALSACNTIKGMGEDVSAAGHDVSKAAGAVQNKMSN
jgi:predicted small secreted protein